MSLAVAVIGVGRWGANLVRTLGELPQFDLRAVCDPRRTELGVPCFATLEQLLDAERVDAVVVATPPQTHASIAAAALRRGVHVFVEKPLCVRDDELMAIELARRGSTARLMVGHLLVYHPAFVALRRWLDARGLTHHERSTIEVTRKSEPGTDPSRCPWWTLASHDVALASRLFGEPRRLRVRRLPHGGLDATLGFDRHNVARLALSTSAPHKVRRFCVRTSDVTLVFDDLAQDKLVVEDRQGSRVLPFEVQSPLHAELAHFAQSLTSGAPFESGHADGAAVVRVLVAGQRSLDAGGVWIDVCAEDGGVEAAQ